MSRVQYYVELVPDINAHSVLAEGGAGVSSNFSQAEALDHCLHITLPYAVKSLWLHTYRNALPFKDLIILHRKLDSL